MYLLIVLFELVEYDLVFIDEVVARHNVYASHALKARLGLSRK
jgi:hypothetical protein